MEKARKHPLVSHFFNGPDQPPICEEAYMGLKTILVVRFTKIFTYIKIQMPKLKCQMNVKAQISKCLIPISIFDI